MSNRSYLSIGDVLTLLRQEFPDVTISKIRFLESQGLVNPERTPSGYRKFYDHDVERLRWVLRQQREHFLPLKVIKDRLDEDPGGAQSSGSAADEPAVANDAEEPVLVGQRTASPSGAVAGGRGVSGGRAGSAAAAGVGSGAGRVRVDARSGGEPSANRAGDGPTLPGIDPSLVAASSTGGPGPVGLPGGSSGPAAVAAVSTAASRSSGRSVPSAPGDEGAPSEGSEAARAATEPAGSTPAAPRRARAARPDAAVPAAGDTPSTPVPPTPPTPAAGGAAAVAGNGDAIGVRGATMSLDELCAASGLESGVIVDLQEYGLLRSMTVAGMEYFDEESLVIATVAARFAQFGIEPRHLRLYKNAADREAGFVEQIVLPLVRQRNPEARVRAHQTVDELAALGEQIRGALLRGALKDLLEP